MNTINISGTKIPLSTQTMAFMQSMIAQVAQLSLLGGTGNYILSGCENTTGSNYLAGWVVINGEILPLTAGSGTSVKIVETKRSVTAGYDTYADLYVERYVEFGSNIGGTNTYAWSTFTRAKSNLQLAAESATKLELQALSNLVMPKGGIIMWSGAINAIPTGYNLCDGSTVTGYGVLPDLRGRFIVGVDPRINQSQPTNVSDLTENYGAVGSTGGKLNVTLTASQSGSPAHTHTVAGTGGLDDSNFSNRDSFYPSDRSHNAQWDFTVNTGQSTAVAASDAHENRPPYFVLAFIIKTV